MTTDASRNAFSTSHQGAIGREVAAHHEVIQADVAAEHANGPRGGAVRGPFALVPWMH
jgi:hypothetical protein